MNPKKQKTKMNPKKQKTKMNPKESGASTSPPSSPEQKIKNPPRIIKNSSPSSPAGETAITGLSQDPTRIISPVPRHLPPIPLELNLSGLPISSPPRIANRPSGRLPNWAGNRFLFPAPAMNPQTVPYLSESNPLGLMPAQAFNTQMGIIRKPQAPATFLHKRSSYYSGSSFNGNPAPALGTQMAWYEIVSPSTSYKQMANVIAKSAMNTKEQSTQTDPIMQEQWLRWLNRGDPMRFMPTPGLNRSSGSLPATSGVHGSSPPPNSPPPPGM